MKRTAKALGASIISISLLCSAVPGFAIGLGDLGKISGGKKTDNPLGGILGTDKKEPKIIDSLLGKDSDLSKLYNAVKEEITDEEAYYLGRSVAANLLTKYPLYEKDPNMESYLNKICQTLAINSDEPMPFNGYHVKILDSDEINAFSTPGGHILVTRGILSCAETEDAIAAIIAHEIAHIQLKHSWETIKSSRLATTLTETKVYSNTAGYLTGKIDSIKGKFASTGIDVTDYLADVISLDKITSQIVDVMVNGYSQEAELMADKQALNLMAAAGYSPSEMVTMLKKMNTVGVFKSHPKPDIRIKAVNLELKRIKTTDTMSFRKSRFIKIK